jgi:shikimate kinase
VARLAIVTLTGFMACGKSTIGRALATRLGWRFVDLDRVIEARAGHDIQTILATHGEREFRRLETGALQAVFQEISAADRCVLAIGGGTQVSEVNARLIGARSVSVWLDCPWPLVHRRVTADARRQRVTRHLNLQAMFYERRRAYARADHHVALTDDDVDDTVRRIVSRLFSDDAP